MEIRLSARRGMSRRTARGNDRVQNAAGAVGEGTDSGLEENPATRAQKRRAATREDRGVLSPHREPQLSADDRAFGAADAGDDHPLLSGMVPDALHRLAAVHGVDIFDFKFLSGLAKGIVPQELAPSASLPTAADGFGHWPDDHEHARRARSAGRQADGLRPDSE